MDQTFRQNHTRSVLDQDRPYPRQTVPGQHGEDHAVVDAGSWVSELSTMKRTKVSSFPDTCHYIGTFLGQPVDLVSPLSENDLFVQQVIKVAVVTAVCPYANSQWGA